MESTRPKPFVFVLMPFHEEFDDTYKVGIKAACKDAGAYSERVDEQQYEGRITDRIYNQIDKADIVVADMTGKNANVFYEVGYAHALGKRVILLTRDAGDIPFDLKDYPHIVYDGKIAQLKDDLEKRIAWMIGHPNQTASSVGFDVGVFVQGKRLTDGSKIVTPSRSLYDHKIAFDLHNGSTEVIEAEAFRFGVVTMPQNQAFNFRNRVTLPDGRIMYFLDQVEALFPGGWTPVSFEFRRHNRRRDEDLVEPASVHMFTRLGPRDIEFELVIPADDTDLPF